MAAPVAVAAAKFLKKKAIIKLVRRGLSIMTAAVVALVLLALALVFGLEEDEAQAACGAGVPGAINGGTYTPQEGSSRVNYSIVAIVYSVGKQKNASERVMLAAFETALVESPNFTNPASEAVPESKSYPHDYVAAGDHDSVGVFQQRVGGSGRDGKPWGTVQQIMDPSWAASRFFDNAFVMEPKTAGTAGELAQATQISAHPERYDQREAQARELIQWAIANERNTTDFGGAATPGGGGAGWVYPLKGNPTITSNFGIRTDPITGAAGENHKGVDYGVPLGTQVFAANAGTAHIVNSTSAGLMVTIDHGPNADGKNVTTRYMHNSEFKVVEGQTVTPGQLIALAGSTGSSTAPHVHFEVVIDGTAVNPIPFLESQGAEAQLAPSSCSAVDGSLRDPGLGAANEEGLSPRAANLKAIVEERWGCTANPDRDPCVTTIYGVGSRSGQSDHPSGNAIDVMVDGDGCRATGAWEALGQEVADFMTANAANTGINYVIWQQKFWSVSAPSWDPMENRGDCNQNHFNHVHISVLRS